MKLTDEFLEKLAEKHVTNCFFDTLTYARAVETLVREAVVQELVAGSGEPALWHDPETGHWKKLTKPDRPTYEGFYTADQLAGAVAIEREWLRKCLLVMEREAKWAFDDLNEEPDVLNADIAALKEHLK